MKMTDEEVEKLEAMKKNRGHELEKWAQIYQIFFQGSSAPSPHGLPSSHPILQI
jgi:hypothetical protein